MADRQSIDLGDRLNGPTVERIIAQNDEALSQFDDDYTPASEVSANSDSRVTDPESVDLF